MIEPIGILTFLVCFLSFALPIRFAFLFFVSSMLLGAASALTLGGSGNIQPAHVLLGPLAILIVRRNEFPGHLNEALRFPSAGFWLSLFVIYGVICAMLIPRIFAGTAVIMSIGSTRYGGNSPIPVPLTPTSGNINQSVYLLADLVCFIVTLSFCKDRINFLYIARLFLVFSMLNIAFAGLDFLTSVTGTAFLLDPIRNADYELHLEENVGGLRRIVGSFTETSLFSYHTIGSFSFCFALFLAGRWNVWSGICALISLFLLILSTSGTAYAALIPVLLAFYVFCLYRALISRCSATMALYLITTPIILITLILFVFINEPLKNALTEFIDVAVFSKSQSQSGVERSQWNRIGMENFYATYGLGNGFGTTRVSSWFVAVLASTGIPGALIMSCFLTSCFIGSTPSDVLVNDVRRAARFCCFGYIIAGALSFSLVDLRLPFFALAAVAAANPRKEL